MKTGLDLIIEERQDQIHKHGRTIEDDVMYNKHEQLIEGAKGLLEEPLDFRTVHKRPLNWDPKIWEKMCRKTHKERLIIAGALIAAEIDRINY